jgi:membrane-associated phospholipid phosphatase
VYAIAPTVGPMMMPEFSRFGGEGAHGLFRILNDALQAAGDAAGTAFPSTHVAGVVTLAWLAWRYCPQWVAWLVTALAISVGPATVYTQNHFLLDAVGGAVLALWLQAGLVPMLDKAYRAALLQRLRRAAASLETEPEAA